MYSKIALSITFMALRVHGCSVITCITAQNSFEVKCVEAVEKNTLSSQLDSLFSDFSINALKTGMLLNETIINYTALKLNTYPIAKIIDPVMVTRTGSILLEDSAINAYKKLLLPIADLVTPNIFEAKLLSNQEINDKQDIEKAAEKILDLGAKAVLIKGGGLKDMKGKDYFLDANGVRNWFVNKFVNTKNTHGSGCTLIKKAKLFIIKSLENSYKIGSGPGPLGHY